MKDFILNQIVARFLMIILGLMVAVTGFVAPRRVARILELGL